MEDSALKITEDKVALHLVGPRELESNVQLIADKLEKICKHAESFNRDVEINTTKGNSGNIYSPKNSRLINELCSRGIFNLKFIRKLYDTPEVPNHFPRLIKGHYFARFNDYFRKQLYSTEDLYTYVKQLNFKGLEDLKISGSGNQTYVTTVKNNRECALLISTNAVHSETCEYITVSPNKDSFRLHLVPLEELNSTEFKEEIPTESKLVGSKIIYGRATYHLVQKGRSIFKSEVNQKFVPFISNEFIIHGDKCPAIEDIRGYLNKTYSSPEPNALYFKRPLYYDEVDAIPPGVLEAPLPIATYIPGSGARVYFPDGGYTTINFNDNSTMKNISDQPVFFVEVYFINIEKLWPQLVKNNGIMTLETGETLEVPNLAPKIKFNVKSA